MHRPQAIVQPVVVVQPRFLVAPLEAGGEVVGGVGGHFLPEKVHRNTVVKIDVLLDGGQVDDPCLPQPPRVVRAQLVHHLCGALRHSHHPGLADEHVVGFFREHEPAGAGQRIETRLSQGRQLVLSVAVGEIGEHQVGKPVRCLLIERPQDARAVDVARMPLQQRVGLLPPVAAEIGVKQVDHRPQVPPFFHVDLEQVAKVV